MLLALLVLSTLIIIGFIRFRSQKNQEIQDESSQIEEETPSSYQTTQEVDESYYREAFSSPEPEESPVTDQGEAVPEPKPKKSPSTKKTSAKKTSAKTTSPKKTAGKKTTTKKSPSKKTTK